MPSATVRFEPSTQFAFPVPPHPDARPPDPAMIRIIPEPPTRHLSQFVVGDEIGAGGMGRARAATDLLTGEPVVVKFLLGGLWASAEQRARIKDETRGLRRLSHPHIVRYVAHGDDPIQGPFLVMAFVDGEILRVAAARFRRPEEAAFLVEKLARAVQHAHDNGVLHRDINLSNVIVRRDGEPILIDFSLARCLDRTDWRTRLGQIMGTFSAMSPEQTNGEEATSASDIWSLGIVLYQLVAQRPPFPGQGVDVLVQIRDEAPLSLSSDIPEALKAICLRCLEKDPAARYASAGALADDLRRYLDGKVPRAVTPSSA